MNNLNSLKVNSPGSNLGLERLESLWIEKTRGREKKKKKKAGDGGGKLERGGKGKKWMKEKTIWSEVSISQAYGHHSLDCNKEATTVFWEALDSLMLRSMAWPSITLLKFTPGVRRSGS